MATEPPSDELALSAAGQETSPQDEHLGPFRAFLAFRSSLGYTAATFLNFLVASTVLGLVTLLGGLVFAGLEVPTANALNSEYLAFIYQLEAQLTNATLAANVSVGSDLYNTLVNNYVLDPSAVSNSWDFHSFSAFLFSFELITTIGAFGWHTRAHAVPPLTRPASPGYGEIAPKTIGGRLWLCLYSFLFIPATGLCLTAISVVILNLLEQAIIYLDPDLHTAWKSTRPVPRVGAYLDNVKAALERVHRAFYDDDAFESHLEEAQVGSLGPGNTVNFPQFLRLYATCGDETTQRLRKFRHLYISSIMVCLWLMMGMFVFNAVEGWGYLASFYFCFVTLSTIGLGDFYPSTRHGEDFHFFFCVTGLGLVAVLLNSIAEVVGTFGGDPNARHEGVEDAIRCVEFEQLVANKAAGVGPAPKKITPKRDPVLSPAALAANVQLAAAQMALSDAMAGVRARDRERALITLMNACSSEPWFIQTVSQYLPPGLLAGSGSASGGQPVVKVFARPQSGKAAASQAIPPYRPTYSQLYEDEPGNLSGAPREGYPVYGERRGATGRPLYDRDAGSLAHGPFPESAATLVGAAAAARAAALDAAADDRLAWDDPRSKGSGTRDPAVPRYREDRDTNRL